MPMADVLGMGSHFASALAASGRWTAGLRNEFGEGAFTLHRTPESRAAAIK